MGNKGPWGQGQGALGAGVFWGHQHKEHHPKTLPCQSFSFSPLHFRVALVAAEGEARRALSSQLLSFHISSSPAASLVELLQEKLLRLCGALGQPSLVRAQ